MFLFAKKFNPKIIFYFSFVFLLFFAHTTFAASLNLSPSSGSYNVGDIIKVRVVLASPAQSVNAVSGSLTFSKDLLTLTSLSKTNSLVSLWATEPSYSNISGTVNMEGVILNGFTGSNGTILTLSFKAKATGNANIKFTSSSVLANNGQGTDILTGTGQASFNISPAKVKEAPASVPATVATPTPAPEPIVVKVLTPIFTDYSKDTKESEFFVVKGFAEPITDILIISDGVVASTNEIVHKSETIKSDDNGVFVYVSGRAQGGMYMITAQARNKDSVLSEKTLPIKISVLSLSAVKTSVPTNIVNTLSLVIPIIGLLILLILLMIWGWHHILNYREYMRKKLMETRNIVSKSFDILGEDVKEEVKIFKKIKALESLTPDERLFINQFKKDIEAAEKTILDKVKE
jgi:hypothetical protein